MTTKTTQTPAPAPMRKFVRPDGSSEIVRARRLTTMTHQPGPWVAQVETYTAAGEWTGWQDVGGPYATEAEANAAVAAYQPCVHVYRDRRETAREVQQ